MPYVIFAVNVRITGANISIIRANNANIGLINANNANIRANISIIGGNNGGNDDANLEDVAPISKILAASKLPSMIIE